MDTPTWSKLFEALKKCPKIDLLRGLREATNMLELAVEDLNGIGEAEFRNVRTLIISVSFNK